jgi:hypothetical protein
MKNSVDESAWFSSCVQELARNLLVEELSEEIATAYSAMRTFDHVHVVFTNVGFLETAMKPVSTVKPIPFGEALEQFVDSLSDIESHVKSLNDVLGVFLIRQFVQDFLQDSNKISQYGGHSPIAELEAFLQRTGWIETIGIPILVAWGWLKTFKDCTAFVRNLIPFTDRLFYLLGTALTEWLTCFLSEEMAGDLKELHHELSNTEESSVLVFFKILGATLTRVWSTLVIFLQRLNFSGEEQFAGLAKLQFA